jgi:hypothetical protein
MYNHEPITFVITNCGTRDVLEKNVLISPCLRASLGHQVLVQQDFFSASKAYNDGIARAANDLLVFLHRDVILPEMWPEELGRVLHYLEREDPRWGVLGCWGATQDRQFLGHLYSSSQGMLGGTFIHPEPVQTLDEVLLILRKSSGLRFDDRLPHFHMYGADICLRAARKGMTSYAIPAFCVHNTDQYLVLPREFYECCQYIKRIWIDNLPIQTTCIRITKSNIALYRKRLKEGHSRYFQRKTLRRSRTEDIPWLLTQADEAVRGL